MARPPLERCRSANEAGGYLSGILRRTGAQAVTDIVERLRTELPLLFKEIGDDAADEIERLLAEVEWLREVVAAAAPKP